MTQPQPNNDAVRALLGNMGFMMSPDMAVITNASHVVVQSNEMFCGLLGHTYQSIQGRSVLSLFMLEEMGGVAPVMDFPDIQPGEIMPSGVALALLRRNIEGAGPMVVDTRITAVHHRAPLGDLGSRFFVYTFRDMDSIAEVQSSLLPPEQLAALQQALETGDMSAFEGLMAPPDQG